MPRVRRQSLRIVTWNVWFGEWQREQRQRALWAELAAIRPDVICLQEVYPTMMAAPELQALRDGGAWVSAGPRVDYDTIVVSQVPVRRSERTRLLSFMGRNLLTVRLDLDPPLTVATVHLESTADATPFRVRQLEDIHSRLAREPDVILVGDMNFPDGDRPEAAPVASWQDAWRICHPDDPGFTVDSQVNAMRALNKPGAKRARIDRAFLRSASWQVERVERLGMSPLREDPQAFISDHFGLMIDLVARGG